MDLMDRIATTTRGWDPHPDRVLVALSGGVDSSVCVRILQEQGFAVEGLVIAFSPAHGGAVAAAQQSASELGIPLAVRNCEPLFEKEVVEPFCQSYAAGETPNPCVVCNPMVKFRILAEEADRRGIRYIATGHYARVAEQDGLYYIATPKSAARDQSYMLYRLGQNILERLCLPLGEFGKDEIREIARALNLSCAEAPDSQEICFIPDGDYPAFIENRGITGLAGRFIGPQGEDLGPHKGVLHYTVGQRRGIGIALGKPVFVQAILPNGDVRLGYSGEEYAPGMVIRDIVTADGQPLQPGSLYRVKIRSRAKAVPCQVEHAPEPDTVRVRFDTPERAPAPGQSAVFYTDDNLVAGGGFIGSIME